MPAHQGVEHVPTAKEASVDKDRLNRVLSLVILFLLSTTLFNTLRANRVEDRTTSFRKQARYELKVINRELVEQKKINARLEQKLDQLLEAQGDDSSSD
jgi:F0F1-type ATP synthase alpha subunit